MSSDTVCVYFKLWGPHGGFCHRRGSPDSKQAFSLLMLNEKYSNSLPSVAFCFTICHRHEPIILKRKIPETNHFWTVKLSLLWAAQWTLVLPGLVPPESSVSTLYMGLTHQPLSSYSAIWLVVMESECFVFKWLPSYFVMALKCKCRTAGNFIGVCY